MSSTYSDDDLVYVDPKTRTVVGKVEWDKHGNAVKMEMKFVPQEKEKDDDEPKRKGRKPKKRYYPWGSYKTMKKIYRIEGKEKEADQNKPFEEVLQKALNEPFWD